MSGRLQFIGKVTVRKDIRWFAVRFEYCQQLLLSREWFIWISCRWIYKWLEKCQLKLCRVQITWSKNLLHLLFFILTLIVCSLIRKFRPLIPHLDYMEKKVIENSFDWNSKEYNTSFKMRFTNYCCHCHVHLYVTYHTQPKLHIL